MAEERTLPGWPKKKLVRDVRRHLSHYGIRPVKFQIWNATWAWASAIARSYVYTHWPLPSEIGTQYILLLLVEMQNDRSLHLPYRANTVLPPELKALLASLQQPRLPVRGSDASATRVRKPSGSPRIESRQQELFHDHGPGRTRTSDGTEPVPTNAVHDGGSQGVGALVRSPEVADAATDRPGG